MGASRWFSGNEKLNTSSLSPEFKSQIPKNKIFEISSMFFNITKHKKEILSKYECYFDEAGNTLILILTEKITFNEFTKEIMMNLFTFTQKVGIDTICFLLAKKNPQYARISCNFHDFKNYSVDCDFFFLFVRFKSNYH